MARAAAVVWAVAVAGAIFDEVEVVWVSDDFGVVAGTGVTAVVFTAGDLLLVCAGLLVLVLLSASVDADAFWLLESGFLR